VRAHRIVTVALLASMAASIGLLGIYIFTQGNAQAEGILLAIALGGVGTAIVVWALGLMHAPVESEPRHPLASPPEVHEATEEALDLESITRRRFLVRLLVGAGGLLAAALVLPAFSLGPNPGRSLFTTAWRAGARVVGNDGKPIRPEDLTLGGIETVFPEGQVGHPDSQTLLIKVRPEDLRLPAGREQWVPDGVVAYSKVCTHAGCPVGLYRADAHLLLCPCHQSTFDVLHGAKPVFGPAARPLPQLPLDVDGEGYLVARGDFPEPVGPSFWNMTHATPGEEA
jgi:ubiquinol-cytochrome c reductase iron-sulfur subunit